jgi:hypothetical protein
MTASHQAQPGFGPNDELDCPVPRLTLLFFGAAKDVPEAAKMVTAGTAWLQLNTQANGPMGALLSSRAAAGQEVHHQRNNCQDQQNVNQPTGNMEREKSQQPQYQQNAKYPDKH